VSVQRGPGRPLAAAVVLAVAGLVALVAPDGAPSPDRADRTAPRTVDSPADSPVPTPSAGATVSTSAARPSEGTPATPARRATATRRAVVDELAGDASERQLQDLLDESTPGVRARHARAELAAAWRVTRLDLEGRGWTRLQLQAGVAIEVDGQVRVTGMWAGQHVAMGRQERRLFVLSRPPGGNWTPVDY
jgi:hypothetical protein